MKINIIAGIAGGTLVPVLFGVLFIIFGGRDVRLSRECHTWPSTRGKIIESHVEERYDDDSSTRYYSPAITYSYEVNGKSFTNNRKSYRSTEDANRAVIQGLLTDYPAGLNVAVFYRPENPEFSVLERVEPLSDIIVYLGWTFIVLGIVIGGFVIKLCRE